MSTETQNNYSIQTDENTVWAVLFLAITFMVVAIVCVSSHYYTERMKAAFAAGYEETVLPGSAQAHWVKKTP